MRIDAAAFDHYLAHLRKTPVAGKTEHTDRGALEKLLQTAAGDLSGIHVQHEPKREPGKGAPDFKITKAGVILGYVENKAIGENLDRVLKSEQIARYKGLSQNLILTDYLDFIWINPDGVQREALCRQDDIENPRYRLRPERVEAVTRLLKGSFSAPPQGIGRAEKLATELAMRARLLRDYLGEELTRQERHHQEGRLFGLYEAFRTQIFRDLALKEFADAFAQMLVYGLFLARLNSGVDIVTLSNARDFVPRTFHLIRELVDFLAEMERKEYREVRWVIEEVLSIVNSLKLDSIHEDLSFRQRKAIHRKLRAGDEEEHRLFERDPFIYFYEDFLKAYDKDMRKSRGVYYTPPPIVNFIVRAVDDILKESFAIRDGLADHKRVTVLDFACGTGTFLLEVFQRIFDNIGGADAGKADQIVREHLLKNMFGFEYLIAPYTIAHLKLSQYLAEQKHPLKDDERLQVFLTNTLEPIEPQKNLLLPAVSAEVEAAQKIKDKKVLAIVGNPPYAGHSKNNGDWIKSAIDGYRFTIETDEHGRKIKTPLGERNPKWLNDDYVKFIRFAQMKMDAVDEGIVGIITNHSWLDNPTFRGMRQSLMRSFQQIYVLDLHGNLKKKETAPDGSKDSNVFDIEQGVAVSLFVKRQGIEPGIWRGDLWGGRLEKYKATAQATLELFGRNQIAPSKPYYLFSRDNAALRRTYEQGWHLQKIMPTNVLGFQTHRDDFAISFDQAEMRRKLRELADPTLSNDELFQRYGLKSNRDWSLDQSRTAARKLRKAELREVSYRPFDTRWCEFSTVTMDYPRRELLEHVAGRDNLVLGVGRFGNAIPERPWEIVTISAYPTDANIFRRGGVNLFPLRRFDPDRSLENLAPDFRAFLDARYDQHYSPEEILGYIYAVLHAPAYRSRYAEFLRIDFPRIPFPESSEDFEALSQFGWALVQAHLLRDMPRGQRARYHGKGDHTVEFVRYAPAEQAIAINETQRFKPVPEDVWNFHIGGYQVIDKYLKSRKGRVLTLDEIDHVGAIADSLAFTIAQMERIDAAYRKALPDRG